MEYQSNILYFDDSLRNFDELKLMINDRYNIFHARTAAESFEILTSAQIQVIIIDQKMLQAAGNGFWEKIKTQFKEPLRLLTGSGDDLSVILRAINYGEIFQYISKPWVEKEIVHTLEAALKLYDQKQSQKHLVGDLKHLFDRLNFLHTISQQISEKKPLPQLLHDIMESSKMVMDAEASSLLLYNLADKKLHFFSATGVKQKLIKKYSVDLGMGIAGWVAEHQKPLLIEDCYNDPRFNPDYDKKTSFTTKSMICVPLIRKNQLLGVVQVINKKGGLIFDERDLTIFETLASQCAIAIENAKLIEIQVETESLERELETAREIQQTLLPSVLPHYDDIQIAAHLIPAKQVGGDYYNILKINANQSLFFIADVTGKSISAAMIVSTISSCLNTYLKLNQQHFDLMTLVTSLNMVLTEATTENKFATCWFGLYHHDTRKLVSINAGHNYPYLFRADQAQPLELQTGGLFLGSFQLPYQTEEIQLKQSDCLVFYTDGVTEAMNMAGEEFGDNRLKDIIIHHQQKDATQILAEIVNDIKDHVGQAQQSDDITCAVVKVL
ncbi:SpoIIE family protein phosphatase [candidate division CSSED10-310 bacterium]|uniref:SpoIIE family protein phosphatase n=1 Tax=candidate division CSSED10-310 bacterium TaxID=2855610 RepID=A0ABV6YVK6_UNCC1